ncbi:phosphohistidine phosphatase [Rhodopirellula rubra]|uniref:Phosphohistidine phosphatase n=1 Tax=Aporhodopirellula rubra TaxID=980271 RepID=A0A7W5E537_9BACT|nr:NUDIX hydrolase [Aporhodopirellula rubra]MBB3210361.1 phosphohistidine phosphatase [Aporhodopirellula rubra]
MLKDLLIFSHPERSAASSLTDLPSDVQAAESESLGSSYDADLTDACKRNAQRVGVWFARENLVPDEVRCVPTLASRTAAQKSCKAAGLNEDIVQDDDQLSRFDESLFSNLAADLHAETACLLIAVGASVAQRLCQNVTGMRGDAERDEAELGALHEMDRVLHIKIAGNGPGADSQTTTGACGRLVQAIDPSALPKRFPFPDINGSERRRRPAYYYRQSAVIPYRIRDHKLEILVISTSKRKRWGVPKGIHDPGKTAQASAANEAMEEAGVLGKVMDAEVGRYSYAKWGATCTVHVYPMEVSAVLPPDRWPESHRGREWLSATAAADRVHQDELKHMIRLLQEKITEQHRDGRLDV